MIKEIRRHMSAQRERKVSNIINLIKTKANNQEGNHKVLNVSAQFPLAAVRLTFREYVAYESSSHDSEHEGQHVLHVSRGFQDHNRQGYGHAGYTACYGCAEEEDVVTGGGEGSVMGVNGM
jgi:hypothetical protein